MNNRLNLQEVTIAITASNLNPTIVNLDFLKYSDIVPADWELACPPVYNNGLARLLFSNGMGIVAQPNRVVFSEGIGSKDLQDLQLVNVVNRAIETLPKVAYQAVGINPVGSVLYDSERAAHQYMCRTLLSPGAWQEFGEAQMQAGIQLSYSLKRGQLNLGINQVFFQASEQQIPAVLFAGNFNYPLIGNSQPELLKDLKQLLQNWQGDVAIYKQLIEEKFLRESAEPFTLVRLTANS